MANHLTPEELSTELGMDRDTIIKVCIEEGVHIYHGKIDKHLFQAQLEALGMPVPQRSSGTVVGFSTVPLTIISNSCPTKSSAST